MSANTGSTPAPGTSRWHLNERRWMAQTLQDDLYKMRGHGEWVSPLGWRVQFGDLPGDPSVTIYRPTDGEVYRRFPDGVSASEFDRTLP